MSSSVGSNNMLESVIEEDEEDEESDSNKKMADDGSADSGQSLSEQVASMDNVLTEFLKKLFTIGAKMQMKVAQLQRDREEILTMSETKDRELANLRCAMSHGQLLPNGNSSSPVVWQYILKRMQTNDFILSVIVIFSSWRTDLQKSRTHMHSL
jgi:hypothetical protein